MYASYVKETIDFSVRRSTFTGHDIQTLHQIMSSLTEAELTLVSRMAMRTKVWLRTEQLIKYVDNNSLSSSSSSSSLPPSELPNNMVNSLLMELSKKEVVDIFDSRSNNNIQMLWGADLNEAWDILMDVLVSDEWKAIYKLLKLSPDLINKRYYEYLAFLISFYSVN